MYGCYTVREWFLFCLAVSATAATASFVFDYVTFYGATFFLSVIIIAGMSITWLLPRKIKDFREWNKNRNLKRR